ncbi:hypothetical protein KIH86_15685 [Paenibacillus sp. HN-1]|uniref:hypothetical protein n=1 Tax=Paenibacillus TaxID=44249 RepID=UPI001CA8DD04|nr:MULTISPECIES: hypothetical protein [Paenibacillus]MBY9077336.1 hypothetical protein [Paenibacillus sp. CGMCC 1.18879]MBY9085656.1 hypothetical protein [Paenibacillus sinensis]
MTTYSRQPLALRWLALLAAAILSLSALLISPLTAHANATNPEKTSISIVSSHTGATQAAANPLQVVTATITFDQNITVSSASALRAELDVSLNGTNIPAIGETSPDPYMVFDVGTIGTNYFTVKIYTPDPPPANGEFSIVGADLTITSASTNATLGKVLNSVTKTGTSNVALWPNTAFSNQIIATGLGFGTATSTPGDNFTSISPSLTIPISSLPQVRGVNYVELGYTDDTGFHKVYATTDPFGDYTYFLAVWPTGVPSLTGCIPLYSGSFITKTANDYANTIASAINYPFNNTGYTATVTGGTLTVTKNTMVYDDGETISLRVINYTNQ